MMKNMGFQRLLLVEPQCEVGIEARTHALKGADVLDGARFYRSLQEVTQDLKLLAGTTARYHHRQKSLSNCRDFCESLSHLTPGRLGVVFGPEDNGLSREELRLCHWLVEIPTGSDYPVLNLAQAVGILAYELHLALHPVRPQPAQAAPAAAVEALIDRIRESLQGAGFHSNISVPRLMTRIRKIAALSRLERQDVKMLQGLLSQLQKPSERG